MSNLNGKFAIVTGGGKGIGAAIVKKFMEEQAAGVAFFLASDDSSFVNGVVLPVNGAYRT